MHALQLTVLICIIVYMGVRIVCFYLILYIMYTYCYVCSVLGIVFHCVVLCIVCVQMCTVLLPPGVNQIPVNKYISYHKNSGTFTEFLLFKKTLWLMEKCVRYKETVSFFSTAFAQNIFCYDERII